jgi:hypothetical protein
MKKGETFDIAWEAPALLFFNRLPENIQREF